MHGVSFQITHGSIIITKDCYSSPTDAGFLYQVGLRTACIDYRV